MTKEQTKALLDDIHSRGMNVGSAMDCGAITLEQEQELWEFLLDSVGTPEEEKHAISR